MRVRTVDVPLKRPLQTAVGEIPTAPLALIDLHTDEGVTGSSYVFCYTPPAWRPSRRAPHPRAVASGRGARPGPAVGPLRRRFTLLGTTGVAGLALGRRSTWRPGTRSHAPPAFRSRGCSGGAAGARIPAYASLVSIAADAVAEEAAEDARRRLPRVQGQARRRRPGADLERARDAARGAGETPR